MWQSNRPSTCSHFPHAAGPKHLSTYNLQPIDLPQDCKLDNSVYTRPITKILYSIEKQQKHNHTATASSLQNPTEDLPAKRNKTEQDTPTDTDTHNCHRGSPCTDPIPPLIPQFNTHAGLSPSPDACTGTFMFTCVHVLVHDSIVSVHLKFFLLHFI